MSAIKTDFWGMLVGENGRRIVIPPIQRDYAQGRDEPKIVHLRRLLVKDLIAALKDHAGTGVSTVDLGLIFGSASGNTVTLYDGQQRLTTLFLLHWYLAWRAGKKDTESAILKQFSYETRMFSRDFCRWLATKGLDAELVRETKSEKNPILETLKGSAEFCAAWCHDPTVSGMIVMLDEIHTQIHPLLQASSEHPPKEIADHLWQQLISGQRIQFTWLVMEPTANNQPDERLYIRLNGRGRPLTEFEKFKAWLEDQPLEISVPKWQKQLDTTWLILFWKASSSPDATSSSMMAFFLGVALNEKLRSHKSKGTTKEKEAENKKITDQIQRVTKGEDITPDDWKELFTPAAVNTIFKLLEFLSSEDCCRQLNEIAIEGKLLLFSEIFIRDPKMAENEPFTKALLAHWTNTGLKERLIFFALTRLVCSLDSAAGTLQKQQAIRFLRMVRNYAENTTIGSAAYAASIRLIEEVSLDHACLPHAVHGPDSDQPIDKEPSTQWEEERYKAAMLRTRFNDPGQLLEEERAFRAAEDQPFLRGQIGFLIKMAGGAEAFNLENFSKYAKCLGLLFPDKDQPTDPILFKRSLLSVGDYPVKIGSRWSFGHKQNEWREVFKTRNDLLRSHLEQLLATTIVQSAGLNKESVESALKVIISQSDSDWSDWRTWMVKRVCDDNASELWCPHSYYLESKFLRWGNKEGSVLLIKNYSLGSEHVELRTYCIFRWYLKSSDWKYQKRWDWNCHAYKEPGDRRIELRYLGHLPDQHPPGQPFAIRVLSKPSARPTGWSAVDSGHGIALSEPERKLGWDQVDHRFAACDPQQVAELALSVSGELATA